MNVKFTQDGSLENVASPNESEVYARRLSRKRCAPKWVWSLRKMALSKTLRPQWVWSLRKMALSKPLRPQMSLKFTQD